MRGERTYEVLNFLFEFGEEMTYAISGFLSAGYGASLDKIQYETEMARHRGTKVNNNEKRKYDQLIYKLKKDGLIEQNSITKTLKLTAIGKKWLDVFNKSKTGRIKSYKKINDNNFVIIAFDISERYRWKRDWLRQNLINLGFKMIQKSVWQNKIKIPKEFLEDIRKLKLMDSVQIFQITKTGSLEKID